MLTTVIGAYPKPDYLKITDWFNAKGGTDTATPTKFYEDEIKKMGADAEAIFDKAAKEVIKDQLDCGIDIITDGEIKRENYIHYHCRHLNGVDFNTLTEKVARTGNYKCWLPTITNKISATDPFLVDEWKSNQSLSNKPVKVTIPGPMTITDTIANTHYTSDEEMGYDLAIAINVEIKRLVDAGCEYIQVDEKNPGTMYVAFGSGNLWKTTNNGISWKPLLNDIPSIGIGDIAIAPSDKKIIYVGTEREALTYRKPTTRVIATEGKMVIPGFHDAHVHPILGGRSITGCDLSGAADLSDLTNILRSCQTNSKKNWLVADGLNLGFFDQSGPTLEWLDNISETRPLLLRASDGHAVSINSRALELTNISRDTSDPPAGLIERDETGAPSGTLRESAMVLAEMHIPTMTKQERFKALQAAITEMNRFGITSIFDAWVGSKDIEAYKAIERKQQLNIRVRAALAYGHGDLFALDPPAKYESLLLSRETLQSDRFHLSAVKLFIDGVLEGETAALVSPYPVSYTHLTLPTKA